jgi:hypothetical protein
MQLLLLIRVAMSAGAGIVECAVKIHHSVAAPLEFAAENAITEMTNLALDVRPVDILNAHGSNTTKF